MSKNYNQGGIGTSVEYGKGGARVRDSGGVVEFRDNPDSVYAQARCADPTTLDDVVNLRTLQQSQAGLFWKDPARLATTGNINIASPGSTFDSQPASAGDRILVKDQTTPVENGVYIFDTPTTPLVRASDFANGDDVDGAALFVTGGNVNQDVAFVQVSSPGVVGTDDLNFIQFASITSGVTSVQSVGGGTSLVNVSGPPTAEIRSLVDSSQITWSIVGGNTVSGALQSDAVNEDNLAPGVGLRQRFVRFTSADMGSTLNIGPALPAGDNVSVAVALRVDTAFVAVAAPPTAEVIEQSAPGQPLQETASNNLELVETYRTEDSQTLASGGQLQLVLSGTASVGSGYVVVTFAEN